MKEKPILFSAPMVRAILEGRKTQTRRVVKFAPPFTDSRSWPTVYRTNDGNWGWCDGDAPLPTMRTRPGKPCPYGQPGDRLWVRETFKVQPTPGCSFGDAMMGRKLSVFYDADQGRKDIEAGGHADGDGIHVDYVTIDYAPEKYGLRRPSIFMPRWASRLTLEITGVRVERLQEISVKDAVAEGCLMPSQRKGMHPDPREQYRDLWNDINGPGSWDANSWVWVVEFKRVQS